MIQDIRYACRLLVKTPSFTGVALATIALGIAANAAIFSVVHALLLAPLPYPAPERLVMLWHDQRARGGPAAEWLSPAHFFDWTRGASSFDATTVFRVASPTLTGDGEPEQLRGWFVTANFFRVLGIAPVLGRDFRAEDDQPGAQPVAILSHGLWIRRFGGDPSIVGRTIALNREPHVVVGVMGESFRSPFASPEIWRPIRLDPAAASRGNISLQMIARLGPGTTLERAQAEMATIGNALAAKLPQTDTGTTIRVTRLHDEVTGNVRTPLVALLGGVLLVLLIACANIANLLLARASVRMREIAVRAALGAGRARIARQLLTESLVLGGLGALLGLLLSSWALELLLRLAPAGTPRLDSVTIDSTVLFFSMALALATSVAFGLVPAIQGSRGDTTSLKEGGGKGAVGSRTSVNARSALVVAELALALTLLVGAGLLMRSLVNVRAVDPGFQPDRLLTAVVTLPATGYPQPDHLRAFHTSVLERLASAPGVRQASIVSVLPFSGEDQDTSFFIEGQPRPTEPGATPVAWYRIVSPEFFSATGMRLEAGRFLSAADDERAEPVVVINRTLANRYWKGKNPIGTRIASARRSFTIVGIAGDVRHRTLQEDPRGQMYLPYRQVPERRTSLLVKTAGDPAAVAPALRAAVAAVDPNLAVANISSVETLLAETLALPRMIAILMSTFAAAALLLAAIGIYGLMAYSVTQRTQEFGIRIALGAASRDVLGLVLGHAARLAVAGVIAGAIAAFAAGRFLSTLLFGITASDVPTFAATAFLLGAIAMLASYLPARRALRVNPVRALRSE